MTIAHFWMGAGATLGAAAMMGLGLGGYVTSPQGSTRNASEFVEATIGDQTAADTSFTPQKGPGAIHCTGCGPTLAERRWQADMAGLDADAMRDGSNDSLMRDYAAEQPVEELVPDVPPVSVHPLPPQVARFAGGGKPAPIIATPTGPDAVPPPTLVATTADTQP